MSTVAVPTIAVQKAANRWGRYKRLLELGAPEIIVKEEFNLLSQVLDEIRAYAIEHGVVPSEADVEEWRQAEDARMNEIETRLIRLGHGDENPSVVGIAAIALLEKDIVEPTQQQADEAIATARAEAAEDENMGEPS